MMFLSWKGRYPAMSTKRMTPYDHTSALAPSYPWWPSTSGFRGYIGWRAAEGVEQAIGTELVGDIREYKFGYLEVPTVVGMGRNWSLVTMVFEALFSSSVTVVALPTNATKDVAHLVFCMLGNIKKVLRC